MRDVGLDYLKLIMALMVVGIHVGFLSHYDGLLSSAFTQGVFRLAVPIFFIINGFYLYESFVNKKEVRIFSYLINLFIIWQLVYLYFYIDKAFVNFGDFMLTFLMGYHHLWYISALIVSIIFVRFICDFSNVKLIFISVSLFSLGCLFQYGDVYGFIPFESGYLYYRNALFVAFPFVIMGFVFRRLENGGSNLGFINIWHVLICAILLTVEACLNYLSDYKIKGFDIPFMIFISSAVFFVYFYKKFPISSTGFSKQFATYSTGIFLIHPWYNYILLEVGVQKGSISMYVLSASLSGLSVYIYLVLQSVFKSEVLSKRGLIK